MNEDKEKEIEVEVVGKVKPKKEKQYYKLARGSKQIKTIKQCERRFADILNYTTKGLSAKETAKLANCAESHVEKVRSKCNQWIKELEDVKGFRELKNDLFDAAQYKVLKTVMQDATLDAADAKALFYGLGTIHKMTRLESGQATSIGANISAFLDLSVPE
jgi:hypothetical protein